MKSALTISGLTGENGAGKSTAINAALEPAETNYYYYALGTDKKHHYFATMNEHTNFVNSDQYGG